MLTHNFTEKIDKAGRWILTVEGKPAPEHLNVRIPPAWTDVLVNTDPAAKVLAVGTDKKGRRPKLYAKWWNEQAKARKFKRVGKLLAEAAHVEAKIREDMRSKDETMAECARLALLTFKTAIRPDSGGDNKADVQAYGACGLQLRHVKPAIKGCRLKFIGKKGVQQSILVTEGQLAQEFLRRKQDIMATPYRRLFRVPYWRFVAYVKTLSSNGHVYTPKDLRTAKGTGMAVEALGRIKRWPKAKAKRKKLINKVLDKICRQLGNTRAVARSSYVDPKVLAKYLPE